MRQKVIRQGTASHSITGECMMTATLDTQALKKLDQAHHLHPFTDFEDYAQNGGRIVSRAEHVYIYDSDGNKIQDGNVRAVVLQSRL
jgi:hypothetical protein